MTGDKNEIDNLIDTMIESGDELVNNLKTVSSRLIKKPHKDHFKKFFWKPALWTRAYCLLTTGGATVEVIKQYIKNQGKSSPEG